MIDRLILTLCAASALHSSLAAAAPDDQESLSKIRKLYAAAQEGKPLSTRKIQFASDHDPMEGTITYRQYKGGLTSILLSYVASDHGGADEHYYFSADGLFFVFEEAFSWRFGPPTAAGESTSIDSLTENRYYFRDGACFHALTREGEATDEKALKNAVSKLPNEVFDPGKKARMLFKRALSLKGLSTGKEAMSYFDAEWDTP